MKHYFDLIPITEKVHRKQSRMVRTCIVLSVFLVASIFGLAEMFMRSEEISTEKKDGAWHYRFQNISMEQADLIAANPEIEVSSWYDILNYNLDEDYTLNGKKLCICGFQGHFDQIYPSATLVAGKWAESANEIVLSKSVQEQSKLSVGDLIEIKLPDGMSRKFQISGFTSNTSMLNASDAFGAFTNLEGFEEICKEINANYRLSESGVFFVKYKENYNARVISERIAGELGLKGKQLQGNVSLLALKGMSDDSYFLAIYKIGAFLAILVSVVGILMISSNLNSNVESKTEFFGMLRCLGATKSQIIRYVRLEALNWCKSAIPEGIALGIAAVWICSAGLKYIAPIYFSEMPIFGISGIGIAAGIIIGLMTVMVAAIKPARYAAAVSPVTAISGNAGENSRKSSRKNSGKSSYNESIRFNKTYENKNHENKNHENKGCHSKILNKKNVIFANRFSIETQLGIHHATGNGKNFGLMTLSFGFSIVLFLAFLTTVDFMYHAVKPLQPYTPDISVGSTDGTSQIPKEIQKEFDQNPAVKKVYGRMFAEDLPVEVNGTKKKVDLISYEQNQFEWAKRFLLTGNIDGCQSDKELLSDYVSSKDIATGDVITFLNTEGDKTLRVGGVVSDTPFKGMSGTGIIICSESTFQFLMGEAGYSVVDLQLEKGSSDQDVAALRNMVGSQWNFNDRRMNNQETRAAFYSFAIFIYGFLVIIGMISVFHILNSVSISVSSRINQYGAMRAVGMTNKQILRMISTEASVYAVCGLLAGGGVGIPLHKYLYERLVTSRWGTEWNFPAMAMLCIIFVLVFSVMQAVRLPYIRVKKLSIADTINAL